MGGGGSKSKNKSNIHTSLVIDAVAKNIMNCKSNMKVLQSFRVTGDYNVIQGVKQVQNVKLSAKCAQDAQNIANLQQSVANAVKQAAESQSVSVLGALGGSDSEVDSTIRNDVKQSITQENITNVINNSNAQQEMVISGNHNIIKDFSQTQTYSIVWDNAQKLVNTMKSVQAIENTSDQSAKATQTNFISDIVDSVFSGLQGFGWMGVAIIAVIAYVLVSWGPSVFLGGPAEEYDDDEEGPAKPAGQLIRPPAQRPPVQFRMPQVPRVQVTRPGMMPQQRRPQ